MSEVGYSKKKKKPTKGTSTDKLKQAIPTKGKFKSRKAEETAARI